MIETQQQSTREVEPEAANNYRPVTFSNHDENVMKGSKFIARAASPSMARRIKNALNAYRPDERGR